LRAPSRLLCTLCLAAGVLQIATVHAQGTQFVTVNAVAVALTHVQLVDGTGSAARADQTVIVRGETIEAVGSSATTPPPSDALVLDLTGHTVLPGQVGLHEHTYFASIEPATGGIRRVTPMNATAPLLYLAYGVTTAMTAGSMLPYHELNLKRAVEADDTPGPTFEIAGRWPAA
jgi:imidazolonepropionase-like amidohydrolase